MTLSSARTSRAVAPSRVRPLVRMTRFVPCVAAGAGALRSPFAGRSLGTHLDCIFGEALTDGDGLAKQSLDRLQMFSFLHVAKRHRHACGAGPSRAADPVHVRLW